MTPEQARIELEKWVGRKTECFGVGHDDISFTMPICDEVVFGEMVGNELKEYTFRYLMCLAYDLQEKKTERL